MVLGIEADDYRLLAPDGHYRGPAAIEQEIVYVVEAESRRQPTTIKIP